MAYATMMDILVSSQGHISLLAVGPSMGGRFEATDEFGRHKVHLGTNAKFYQSQVDHDSFSPLILELCAGFGGAGIGASFIGGKVAVSVDNNQLAA